MKNIEYLKLMAEWMDQTRLTRDGRFDARDEELEYWTRHARESNGPALEIASGSGKVLIPLLERGVDISGLDNSEAMLERCRAMCKERNVTPTLYNQSVQQLDLPRTYGLIFGNSGFLSLFVEDVDVTATLESVKRHLNPGGTFICTFEQARGNPRVIEPHWGGGWFRGVNGAIYAHRSLAKDRGSRNLWEYLLIIEKYVDGRLVETEANQRMGRVFAIEEVLRFFESAGFESLRALNGFTDQPASTDGPVIATLVARKPMQ